MLQWRLQMLNSNAPAQTQQPRDASAIAMTEKDKKDLRKVEALVKLMNARPDDARTQNSVLETLRDHHPSVGRRIRNIRVHNSSDEQTCFTDSVL
mmetsp:Transcript_32665/g.46431  ORF Transcript_32665/g.46431 Transcript_32665/m.46431 type:complete len:95 (-) Transcript_32665:471-755(-)